MKRKVRAVEYECDCCGHVTIMTDDEPPNGITGTALEVTNIGGNSAEWYACKRGCIAGAIVNALQRRGEE